MRFLQAAMGSTDAEDFLRCCFFFFEDNDDDFLPFLQHWTKEGKKIHSRLLLLHRQGFYLEGIPSDHPYHHREPRATVYIDGMHPGGASEGRRSVGGDGKGLVYIMAEGRGIVLVRF